MAGIMKLLAVVVGLLFLVPDTMQLSVRHPALRTVVDRINVEGPFLALVVSSSRDEKILKNSSYYEADSTVPYITIAGRIFNFGTFNGEVVIYVIAGEPLSNVGATVQLLLSFFDIKGIISYGAAATVSNQVFIGDVVVPSQVSFTNVWKWEKYGSEEATGPALNIGEYNVPEGGENQLQHIEYLKTKRYTPTSSKKSTFWFNVHNEWIQLASQINFGERPTVHIGGAYNLGSSDIYISNAAYATFLNKQLNVTAVDTESAAVVAVAIANDVPHIVFRGASNRPGTESDSRLSEVTAKNVLKAVARFIESLSPKKVLKTYADVN